MAEATAATVPAPAADDLTAADDLPPAHDRPTADPIARALARVHAAAGRRDQSGESLAAEVGWLHAVGLIAGAMPAALSGGAGWADDPLAVCALLRRVGAASLPLGRLFEGHVNALHLIGLFGAPALRARCAVAARGGALFGVWGADGTPALTATAAGDGAVLAGGKSFCSGVGLVQWALVSAWAGNHTRLFCVDVRDPARADAGQWQVSGMRATRSGGYDFSGLHIAGEAAVGGPDAYFVEPWFLGGMVRMCAVQVGGLDALVAAAAAALRRRGRQDDAVARLRLGRLGCLRFMAGAATEAVARRLAAGDARAEAETIAREAMMLREGVEGCIVEALAIVARALGTEVHRETSAVSRLHRDLAFYIRQAAVDDRLAAVGGWLMAADAPA